MFLLVSNQIFCQSTNTKSINISQSQVTEIYKGLKQNEYLKSRLQKTEKALKSADVLISEQEKALAISQNLSKSKDAIISTMQEVAKQEKNASEERENQLKVDKRILEDEIRYINEESKQKQRKKFWSGVKVGGFSVVVLGVVALVAINQ